MTESKGPKLDALMIRVFDDNEPGNWRTGWWAGVLSVFLGVIAVGAVLTLRFPGWLTTEMLRAHYPLKIMRGLIELVIGLAFLSGCASLLQRRKKTLGVTGVALALTATLLGGGRVPITGSAEMPWYLGFDWFLLNVFLLALIFVPLERVFPQNPTQKTFRRGWTTDVVYVFVSHVGVQALTFLSLLPATLLGEYLVFAPLRGAVAAQPLLIQALEIMLVADVLHYWIHRAFHAISWLWPFHAIHHSSRELDWLAGSRLHLVDVLVTRAIVFAPFLLLGFDALALTIWLGVVTTQALFNHVNLRLRLKTIEGVLVTPRYHHWHHATAPINKNFAVHFPWLDKLFGTHHLPEDGAWPPELGIEGHPVPEDYLDQLVYPLTAHHSKSSADAPPAP
jgi:sterol desaturase/sphingolipid hydroxylase (fatty acid hydroxylase superfamily)